MNLISIIQKVATSAADFLSKKDFIKRQRREYLLRRSKILKLNVALEVTLVWTIVASLFIETQYLLYLASFALFVILYTKYILEDY